MDLNGIPLFSMLKSRLGYLSERQQLIAQNVANASTPGFTPKDLKPFANQPGVADGPQVGALQPVAPAMTQAAHMTGTAARLPQSFQSVTTPDSETTLNGNQVVLEEQMIKMSEARTDYDAAIGFYQKALNMLHMAAHRPGT